MVEEGLMRRMAGAVSVLALAVLGFAGPSAAHHPPRFERCESLAFDGQVTRIDWVNPHVTVAITDHDGVVRELSWLNVRQLGLAGIERTTLRVGDRVSVTATHQAESTARAVLQEIRRSSDDWHWSREQGC
jgi:Family of unknown function (DUF6152)